MARHHFQINDAMVYILMVLCWRYRTSSTSTNLGLLGGQGLGLECSTEVLKGGNPFSRKLRQIVIRLVIGRRDYMWWISRILLKSPMWWIQDFLFQVTHGWITKITSVINPIGCQWYCRRVMNQGAILFLGNPPCSSSTYLWISPVYAFWRGSASWLMGGYLFPWHIITLPRESAGTIYPHEQSPADLLSSLIDIPQSWYSPRHVSPD